MGGRENVWRNNIQKCSKFEGNYKLIDRRSKYPKDKKHEVDYTSELQTTRGKEQIRKAERAKRNILYKGRIKIIEDSMSEIMQVIVRKQSSIFKYLIKLTYQVRLSFKNEEKMKTFLDTHKLKESIINRYTHTGLLSSLRKEGNLANCDNMDGPGGHYAKWNKLDRERQILCDLASL